MNVLIACEESQTECIAFRKRGHNAFSCDIQNCSGGFPEWHVKGDVLEILNPINGKIAFTTCTGVRYEIPRWDMIIAHPPCTYLSVVGACNNEKDPLRIEKGFIAAEFFKKFLQAECDRICVENPRPQARFNLPPKSQVIQPYEFGEPWSKRTYLWLKGLPPLFPVLFVLDYNSFVACKCGSKARSKSFKGIAEAMAKQWGAYL